MPILPELLAAGAGREPDAVLDAIVAWAAGQGLSLYPAQEEAILEVLAGANVIVDTPTGSGKSMIALGAHFSAWAAGRRSFYTAPIKALVSEKFFALSAQLGPANVGMLTGDGAVNAGAPIICCTAEILANMALRDGADADVDQVVMDEFHFYADPDRGWAWQVPLLELSRAQFVLMSATLGSMGQIRSDLTRRTGRPTALVRSATRPVPLDYDYARTPLHDTIEALVGSGRAPVYVVYFTQAAAVAQAQALTSSQLTTRTEKDAIAAEIAQFRFSPGFGQTLARFVRHGVGVHHAGMLPKYRRLVERLAQDGRLKVICGTDTLGVGINVPIRTVVFTGLAKYDGTVSRLLTAREFHQIAGRAGRAGYDDAGTVVVQAPEHVIDNERAVAKAGDDPRKRRKLVKAKPPKGFVPWTEETYQRLIAAPPEPLRSSFDVSHSMILDVLDRPGDGCAALRFLLTENDDERPAQRRHILRAVAMYRSLLASGVVQRLDAPDEFGRRVRVATDLQSDFALNQPLSPFALMAIPQLDRSSPVWPLDVVSVVESTLDNPGPVLAAQLDRLRTETIGRLKAEGVEYEERMEALDGLEYPKPLREWTYDLFDTYRIAHPWAADYNIRPKSVARDLYERAMTFAEYVAHYQVARSEGLLLRYLSDAYKGLVQNVPEDVKTDELIDLTEWLGELVRQVDSSLLDEWEALQHPIDSVVSSLTRTPPADEPPPLTANVRAFRVMVRNAVFRRVEWLARQDCIALAGAEPSGGWDAYRWQSALAGYFEEYPDIGTGAAARSPQLFQVSVGAGRWDVRQVLDDPAGDHEWALSLTVDLEASDREGVPVLRTSSVGITGALAT